MPSMARQTKRVNVDLAPGVHRALVEELDKEGKTIAGFMRLAILNYLRQRGRSLTRAHPCKSR